MIKKKTEIEILQTEICDEIRREDNGKFILIGVYPDAVFLNMLPTELTLSIWMRCEITLYEKMSLEFELSGDPLLETIKFISKIGEEQIFGKKMIIPIVLKILFKLKQEGNISIKYRLSGNETWMPVTTISIKKNMLF